MVRIGLIGTGFMGGTHLAAYKQLAAKGGFRIAAVADLDTAKAAKLAEGLGAKVFADGDDLLNNADIDTVDICLPTYLHHKFALKALNKGLNVFVEKPLSLNSAQADELARAAADKGVITMVGQCIRFWDEYVYLKDIIRNQTYGKVITAHFRRLSPRPEWGWQNWLLKPELSGGAATDLHIHDTDYVIDVFGKPDNLTAVTNAIGERNSYISALYRYSDCAVTVEGTWNMPSSYPFEMYYRVVFEHAVIEFSSIRGISGYTAQGAFVPEVVKQCTAESDNLGGNISDLGGYYNELNYFLDCLIARKPASRATFADGAQSVRMIEKELDSAL